MPIRHCCFLLVVIASLALAPVASAHHHWNNGDNQDQTWMPPAQDPAPAPQPQPQGWDPSQGNAPETPSVWNQSPPVSAPPQQDNPWNSIPALPISKTPTVAGKTAMIRRNGLAAIPKGAPARVRAIISAANRIIGKPYKWGGGHGRLFDSGYDCSGSVSYALIRAGLLGYPMVSGSLAHWGASGLGKYVTIYANKSHVYMEVAGLRLDTSSVGDGGGKNGVRWRPPIGKRFGFAVRHISGL
jgi:cell wall-associated NlpC family hydrolase